MSIASSQQSFLTNALSSTHKPKRKNILIPVNTISYKYQSDDPKESSRKNENQLAKLAIAAESAVRPLSHQAPRPSGPRINNSRTNVYINPPVAPPLVGGYGYGYGVPFYGGWGWSPFSFFAPGPSVAIGVGGGFDTFVLFLFLGAAAAVIRRFFRSREEEDDY
ncbi:hypothetical protein F0562_030673 [Nyssa sinensis]|uniref:Transmembrane protein n=1 Tax=Nyssa sinensis TaxID=561372 RepID=A0A5J5AZE9_9ASTE|nr:hypothetical protein F0562_030673 [Nyssa sinensis]